MCGCGTQLKKRNATFARGHYGRGVGGFHHLPPEEKDCEHCGRTFSRSEVAHRQSNKHWAARRFCGQLCQEGALAVFATAQRGELHPSWKGGRVTPNSGRSRALKLYVDVEPCRLCIAEGIEQVGRSERHHKDGDTRNNGASNIDWLCRTHHIRVEDRMAYRRGKPGRKTGPRDPEQFAEIQRLRAAGWTQKAVAKHLGISQPFVSYLLKLHG